MVPTEIYKEGGVAMNCKDCKHLIPQDPKDPDVMCCEWMDNKFVCSSSYHIKTHPRWCPLRGKGPLATIVRKGNIEVVVK